MSVNTGDISTAIAKGAFNRNIYLTTMAMAYFQNEQNRPAKSLFPILPVRLSSASYYIWSKEDLLRDNVHAKPQFGKVDPAQIAHETGVYDCTVEQIILGIDQIEQINYARTNAPAFMNKQNMKTKTISQQMAIHQDILFAEKFFKKGVWGTDMAGADNASASNSFVKFSDSNSEPIPFFRNLISDLKKKGRKPNKLGLGEETYNALINHPSIIERVTGQGSSSNPAQANENVLATLFGVDKVVVFDSIVNKAKTGADGQMDFICDPKGALLLYATDAPSIEEPSAGYIFTWDPLGDGNYLPVLQWTGENGTHSEYIEGLMSMDMKVTSPDLGAFLSDCV